MRKTTQTSWIDFDDVETVPGYNLNTMVLFVVPCVRGKVQEVVHQV